jgi:hypothetical protein
MFRKLCQTLLTLSVAGAMIAGTTGCDLSQWLVDNYGGRGFFPGQYNQRGVVGFHNASSNPTTGFSMQSSSSTRSTASSPSTTSSNGGLIRIGGGQSGCVVLRPPTTLEP